MSVSKSLAKATIAELMMMVCITNILAASCLKTEKVRPRQIATAMRKSFEKRLSSCTVLKAQSQKQRRNRLSGRTHKQAKQNIETNNRKAAGGYPSWSAVDSWMVHGALPSQH